MSKLKLIENALLKVLIGVIIISIPLSIIAIINYFNLMLIFVFLMSVAPLLVVAYIIGHEILARYGRKDKV